MEIYSILIQDNATGRKELWDLWQRIIGNSRSSNKIKTISVGHHRKIQSLDRSWKSQIFHGTSQIEWMISEMVLKITRLWFHIIPYSGKNKYKSRHPIKQERIR